MIERRRLLGREGKYSGLGSTAGRVVMGRVMEPIRRRTGIEKKRKGAADGGGQGPAVQTRQPDPFAVKSAEIVERRFCWDRKPIAPVYGRYGGGRRWDGMFACMREAKDKEIIIPLAPCRAVRSINLKRRKGNHGCCSLKCWRTVRGLMLMMRRVRRARAGRDGSGESEITCFFPYWV